MSALENMSPSLERKSIQNEIKNNIRKQV